MIHKNISSIDINPFHWARISELIEQLPLPLVGGLIVDNGKITYSWHPREKRSLNECYLDREVEPSLISSIFQSEPTLNAIRTMSVANVKSYIKFAHQDYDHLDSDEWFFLCHDFLEKHSSLYYRDSTNEWFRKIDFFQCAIEELKQIERETGVLICVFKEDCYFSLFLRIASGKIIQVSTVEHFQYIEDMNLLFANYDLIVDQINSTETYSIETVFMNYSSLTMLLSGNFATSIWIDELSNGNIQLPPQKSILQQIIERYGYNVSPSMIL